VSRRKKLRVARRISQIVHYALQGWSFEHYPEREFCWVLKTVGPNGGILTIPGRTRSRCVWRLWKHTGWMRAPLTVSPGHSRLRKTVIRNRRGRSASVVG